MDRHNMNKPFFYTIAMIILLTGTSCKQLRSEKQEPKEFSRKLEELVISEKEIGKEYFMRFIDIQNDTKYKMEYRMVYLGSLNNVDKGKLDFMYNTIFYSLFSEVYEYPIHANSIIAIYSNNKRLGHYYVGGDEFYKNPIILNGEIVISYDDDSNSDCNQTTRISFKDSIPQMIFIHCKEKNGKMFGDLYNFENQDKKTCPTKKLKITEK